MAAPSKGEEKSAGLTTKLTLADRELFMATCEALGFNASTALKAFVKKLIAYGGFPFELRANPNDTENEGDRLVSLNVKVLPEDRERFMALTRAMGMNGAVALKVFIKKFNEHGGFPFEIRLDEPITLIDENAPED